MILDSSDSKVDSTKQVEEKPASGASTSKGPGPAPDERAEQPPPYSPREVNASLSGPSDPIPEATNFISLFKPYGSLKGTWVINPTIPLPAPFFHPADPTQAESVHKNLYLKTHNGSIRADVSLVPTVYDDRSRAEQSPFVALEAETVNGSITLTLHELTLAYPGKTRLPVHFRLVTHNGAVYVKIPRSFRGMILSQCRWGSTKLSDQVRAQVNYERDEGHAKRMFVGGFDEADFSESSWSGDELNAETKSGNVYVKYEDEIEEPGFWSKLWSSLFSPSASS